MASVQTIFESGPALGAAALNAAVVCGDDFFAAALTDDDWNARSPEERARDTIDWND